MFVPGTNSWGVIGAATTATSDITMGAVSLSDAVTPEEGATPEATQVTGVTQGATAPETGATPDAAAL